MKETTMLRASTLSYSSFILFIQVIIAYPQVSIINFFLQVRKLRLKKLNNLLQSYAVKRNQDSHQGLADSQTRTPFPKPALFSGFSKPHLGTSPLLGHITPFSLPQP